MGTYYHLLNDTKRERVHLAYHVKSGPLTLNKAVHFALVNYMMCNQRDTMRLCPDTGDDGDEYADTDLLSYKFDDEDVLPKIVAMLNEIYEAPRYVMKGGIGTELALPQPHAHAPQSP